MRMMTHQRRPHLRPPVCVCDYAVIERRFVDEVDWGCGRGGERGCYYFQSQSKQTPRDSVPVTAAGTQLATTIGVHV